MEQSGNGALHGKKVAVLMTDGVEQVEYTGPRNFLEQHGAQVILISPKAVGEAVQGMHHDDKGDTFPVEMHINDARPGDFDALLLPGGEQNPLALRKSPESIAFIRDFYAEDKPIAAICHAPWTLIDAGIAESKNLTSWPEIQDDMKRAGAEWVDQEVVIDEKLITSRKPDDIPAFNDALLKALKVDPQAADIGPSS
ncbi:type 1 glutamine amidotransferase [Massilia sp. Dwa41.01b]|uniref:type 1 glutamine amidotransferase domain-containing protein n=1 Tax=unclassified Massilia TaxID=2609279 RepID=UPI001603F0BA|nr:MULTISPECIES: type 1 glutamine amidotransferase domain-containing protein [unclassified Massilia]QNA88368.1 type 1 glutamine amidotransferase [Massilia sp. Dwa41.01b]QNA99267.1 type 1 glutamine amidotransferase [Massilia sp. Se16.2.3]